MLALRSLMFPVQYREVGEAFFKSKGWSYSRLPQCLVDLGVTDEGYGNDVPPGFMNGEQFAALLSQVSKRCSPDRAVSEQILRHMPVSAHGALGLLGMVAKTVGEGLNYAIQFSPVVMPAFAVKLIIVDDQAHLTFERQADFGELNALMAELVLGSYAHFQAFAEAPLPQSNFYFRHEPVGVPMTIPDRSALCVHFCCREDKIVMPKAFLDRPSRMSSPGSKAALISLLTQQADALAPSMPFTQMTKQVIQADLLAKVVSEVTTVAGALQMSPRTLSRRLYEEGASFSTLNVQVRVEHAKALLLNTTKLISQIAEEAGFTDVGNFSRAFRRVFGQTPSGMRSGR